MPGIKTETARRGTTTLGGGIRREMRDEIQFWAKEGQALGRRHSPGHRWGGTRFALVAVLPPGPGRRQC